MLLYVDPLVGIFCAYVMERHVYPWLDKRNLLKSQLQRIRLGLLIAVFSFFIVAALESCIQTRHESLNRPQQLRVVNLSPCHVTLTFNDDDEHTYETSPLVELAPSSYLQNQAVDMPRAFVRQHLASETTTTRRQVTLKLSAHCASTNGDLNNERRISQSLTVDNRHLPKTLLVYRKNETHLDVFEYAFDVSDKRVGAAQIKTASFMPHNRPTPQSSSLNLSAQVFVDIVNQNGAGGGGGGISIAQTLGANGVNASSSLTESSYSTLDYGDYKLQATAASFKYIYNIALFFSI